MQMETCGIEYDWFQALQRQESLAGVNSIKYHPGRYAKAKKELLKFYINSYGYFIVVNYV